MKGSVTVICKFCGHEQDLMNDDLLGSVGPFQLQDSEDKNFNINITHICEECSAKSEDEYLFEVSEIQDLDKCPIEFPYIVRNDGVILVQGDL